MPAKLHRRRAVHARVHARHCRLPRRHTPRPFPAQLLVVQGAFTTSPVSGGVPRSKGALRQGVGDANRRGRVRPVLLRSTLATGECFTGETPTKPWTVGVREPSARREYPGRSFSDSATRSPCARSRRCARPAELRRCLTKGEKDGTHGDGDVDVGTGAESGVPTRVVDAAELAVKEFATLDGVGDKTAIAIARSTAFSHLVDVDGAEPAYEGRRLRGLAELIECVREGGARPGEGEAFVRWWLQSSPELPAATTRWPPWCARIVPRVMDQLRGSWRSGRRGAGTGGARAASATRSEGTTVVLFNFNE